MRLAFHGGLCCGVKTIYELGSRPTDRVAALGEADWLDNDRFGSGVDSRMRFFHAEAPLETAEKRLDRYIAYCKWRRPAGAIEIVLADYGVYSYYDEYEGTQTSNWEPALLERGFQKLTSWINSNTDNTCTVYYLTYCTENDEPDCEEEFEYNG